MSAGDGVSSTRAPALAEDEWPVTKDSYELMKHIGKGAFANVHSAMVMDGSSARLQSRKVAIKIIDLESITSDMDDIRKEVATLRLCSHPNVLQYYVSFVDGRNLWLVTELMSKGSCLHIMNIASSKLGLPPGMKEDWLGWILLQTLKALKYFHEQGQIHRDIKAGNILMDERGHVSLADFGVSRWVNANATQAGQYHLADPEESDSLGHRARTFVGTPCWMAPEVMEQIDGYNYKADIWSVGITALELAKGQAPYANHPPMKVLLYTIQNEPPSLRTYSNDKYANEPFSQNFKQFVRMCLQKNPDNRPNCTTLLANKFFSAKKYGPEKLVEELLDKIDDVSSDLSSMHESQSEAVDVRELMAEALRAEGIADTHMPLAGEHVPQTQDGSMMESHMSATPSQYQEQPPLPHSEPTPTADQEYWAFTEYESNIRAQAEIARQGMQESSPVRQDLAPPQESYSELDDRTAQEEYAKKVGGIDLYSEEEVNGKTQEQRAADELANEEVIGAINEIMHQEGGEGRRIRKTDDGQLGTQ